MVAAESTTAGDIFGAIGEEQHSQSFCARPAVATLYSGVGDALAVRGVKNLESLGMVPGAAVMRNRTRGSACLGPRSYGGQQWVGLGPLLPQTRAAADGTAFAERLAPCEQPNGVASAARLVPFTSSHSHQVGGRAGPSFRHRRRGHGPPSARSLQRVPGLRTHLPQGPGQTTDPWMPQDFKATRLLQGCKAARLQAMSMLSYHGRSSPNPAPCPTPLSRTCFAPAGARVSRRATKHHVDVSAAERPPPASNPTDAASCVGPLPPPPLSLPDMAHVLPIPAPGAAELLHHGCGHDSSALVCLCDRCKDRHRLHDRPALTSTVNAEPSMPFSKSDALARGSAAQTRLTLCWDRHACLRCIATNRECDVPALTSNPTTSHPSRSENACASSLPPVVRRTIRALLLRNPETPDVFSRPALVQPFAPARTLQQPEVTGARLACTARPRALKVATWPLRWNLTLVVAKPPFFGQLSHPISCASKGETVQPVGIVPSAARRSVQRLSCGALRRAGICRYGLWSRPRRICLLPSPSVHLQARRRHLPASSWMAPRSRQCPNIAGTYLMPAASHCQCDPKDAVAGPTKST
ncbi:hypothetical protein Purlil1_8484 [Purpureocillium lilacinum]|uniref:Uncharacterized protein n=1 Tax=Purpureocillium lilacinum TaxID=33203 RepID=A0ABR0BTG5_PURLI|nr:hypothetical protein Purlil1_8484 [Purpureocillium lilacinum]